MTARVFSTLCDLQPAVQTAALGNYPATFRPNIQQALLAWRQVRTSTKAAAQCMTTPLAEPQLPGNIIFHSNNLPVNGAKG